MGTIWGPLKTSFFCCTYRTDLCACACMVQGASQCTPNMAQRPAPLPLTLAGGCMLPAHARGHLTPDLGGVVAIVLLQVGELILHPPQHEFTSLTAQGNAAERETLPVRAGLAAPSTVATCAPGRMQQARSQTLMCSPSALPSTPAVALPARHCGLIAWPALEAHQHVRKVHRAGGGAALQLGQVALAHALVLRARRQQRGLRARSTLSG